MKAQRRLYEFGPFRLDASERQLSRRGRALPLTPKAIDVLLVLVENSTHTVEKDDLMERVWPNTCVEEVNLANNVSLLRKVLGNGDRYIQTVPRRGYRFVAAVTELRDELDDRQNGSPDTPAPTKEQEARSPQQANVSEEPTVEKQIKLWSGVQRSVRRVWSWKIAAASAIAVCLIVITILSLVSSQPNPIAGPRIRTLAVLPFKPLVSDSHNESLEVGMSETLITRLSSTREVAVRPLSAVLKYTDPNQHPASAGRELLVDAVLDGSIQLTSDRIRVTVRLTRVSDEVVLWSEPFDENWADVFTMQDSICAKVTAALALRLNTEEKTHQAKHYTENPTAYQLY